MRLGPDDALDLQQFVGRVRGLDQNKAQEKEEFGRSFEKITFEKVSILANIVLGKEHWFWAPQSDYDMLGYGF